MCRLSLVAIDHYCVMCLFFIINFCEWNLNLAFSAIDHQCDPSGAQQLAMMMDGRLAPNPLIIATKISRDECDRPLLISLNTVPLASSKVLLAPFNAASQSICTCVMTHE